MSNAQGPGEAPSPDIDYNRRALSRAEYGDYRGAIQDYTQGLAFKPTDVVMYVNKGLAKVELKDVKELYLILIWQLPLILPL